MHLLQTKAGEIPDGSAAVDLGQTPGDIVFLSAADTELACLAQAYKTLGADFPTLRLANVTQLTHPLSVDMYVDAILVQAKVIVVRLLGGKAYWPYVVEQIVQIAERHKVIAVLLPGDDQPDPELFALSTLTPVRCHRLWQYCVQGGAENARHFLAYAATLIGHDLDWLEPRPLVRAGLYWPDSGQSSLQEMKKHWHPKAPVAAIVFYRVLMQANNLAPIDALIREIHSQGINPLPLFCSSLKDAVSAEVITEHLVASGAKIVLNTTGFSVSNPTAQHLPSPFAKADCPVLQVILAGSSRAQWEEGTQGLSPRDIAMNIALPEVDGRIITRAISFKAQAEFDPLTQCSVVNYVVHQDRVRFIVRLAAAWLSLANTQVQKRHIALILANYPNRDGRLGNGVGLDTPESTLRVLQALCDAGYRVENLPQHSHALIADLQKGPTNAQVKARVIRHTLTLEHYTQWFTSLPDVTQGAVLARWGEPDTDPFYLSESAAFAIPAVSFGNITVGLQPARGYNIDPATTYHDPDLVPPHGYFAFYLWLREIASVQAVVHMGKHGNLEWLPGKALALSETCYPELALGPLPHLYPFIVNDPGEGTQAKRRSQAVIVDHLTPSLARAEVYGVLAELERLVDEYYEAMGIDQRRLRVLQKEILALAAHEGLDQDCGIGRDDIPEDALGKLDNYLCELKESQIRDGLHVFGESPRGELLDNLLLALARLPRGPRESQASLLRAIADDLGFLDFDPLDCELGAPWQLTRPGALDTLSTPWRTVGDTIERLENLAKSLIKGDIEPTPDWSTTRAVLDDIEQHLRPRVEQSGAAELKGIITGLNGQFVVPGPSGAPTRGRPDVLPTGRNFYSVDSRVIPTPTAWQLGWKSASLLVDRYRQDHGEWPRELALSAWGTANMRTGGDDIAQALALLGVKPTWDVNSRRVTGFEIFPLSVLDRPRVDVTLRVSGFFRDAFPAQIELFDAAVRAIAMQDESAESNPLAARARTDQKWLEAQGVESEEAQRRSTYRIFGSKPGAYGAGLQALIDERGWVDSGDLARAYLSWSGYAYGAGVQGAAEHRLFERRLSSVQAVLHNQDNREHDLLDSDDYYQFEGGLSVAIRELSGTSPTIYHNDHSRPERPRIRHLEEEIAQVVRARVINPKWIRGVMRHGYKGAFEMAATVDYLFAFSATTEAVANHHFDAVYTAYLENDEVHRFLMAANPSALVEMAERFLEAEERGLWQPRSNSARMHLQQLIADAYGKGDD